MLNALGLPALFTQSAGSRASLPASMAALTSVTLLRSASDSFIANILRQLSSIGSAVLAFAFRLAVSSTASDFGAAGLSAFKFNRKPSIRRPPSSRNKGRLIARYVQVSENYYAYQ
ncbi:hypothetical protein [Bacillus velezensis]|uniref:hypothetical protein n=1 Tax=Bacillus velezensis TaxID=492670 RepID=UPI001F2B426E|nr:hypothetical protein [Bacillus velezensis]